MINFVTFMRVLVFFCETQARLAQILRTILMLRMQEMAFPGFKFQKFSGGGCPRTPLLGVAYGHACGLRPQCYGRILWLDPPLVVVDVCVIYVNSIQFPENFLSQLW